MPRDGAGQFSRQYSWVSDRDSAIPITASRMDADADDVATALTNSIAKDGQTTTTGVVPFAGGGIKTDDIVEVTSGHGVEIDGVLLKDGRIDTTRSSDVASAATINLETATGNVVDVTGTTTITAVTLSAGHWRWVRFTGVLTLTHGASLVLPGSANITTAAGDWALFVGFPSSVVRVAAYLPVAGIARLATTALAGLLEISTDAEAQAKSATDKALVASNLAALDATDSMSGFVENATTAEVRSATSGKNLLANHIEDAAAAVALSDGTSIALDWDTGINFTVTLGGNRTLANPSNGQPGTWRTILVQGNDTTDRTITFGNQYLGDTPTITDCDSGTWYLLMIYCATTSHFVVSSKKAKG